VVGRLDGLSAKRTQSASSARECPLYKKRSGCGGGIGGGSNDDVEEAAAPPLSPRRLSGRHAETAVSRATGMGHNVYIHEV